MYSQRILNANIKINMQILFLKKTKEPNLSKFRSLAVHYSKTIFYICTNKFIFKYNIQNLHRQALINSLPQPWIQVLQKLKMNQHSEAQVTLVLNKCVLAPGKLYQIQSVVKTKPSSKHFAYDEHIQHARNF